MFRQRNIFLISLIFYLNEKSLINPFMDLTIFLWFLFVFINSLSILTNFFFTLNYRKNFPIRLQILKTKSSLIDHQESCVNQNCRKHRKSLWPNK